MLSPGLPGLKGFEMSAEEKSIESIATRAPHWAALVLIVGGFLYFMDRQQATADLVADQRIETCHAAQERATAVLDRLDQTLTKAATEDALLRASIIDFQRTLDRHTTAVERLLLRLDGGHNRPE